MVKAKTKCKFKYRPMGQIFCMFKTYCIKYKAHKMMHKNIEARVVNYDLKNLMNDFTGLLVKLFHL